MCEMYITGFRFAVLNNGFLVHMGFKEQDTFHEDKQKENRMNAKLFDQFSAELVLKYPETERKCGRSTPRSKKALS